MIRRTILTILVFPFILYPSWAQISEGGQPPSFTEAVIRTDFNSIHITTPDMSVIMAEDEEHDNTVDPLRIGVLVPVNKDIMDEGSRTQVPGGGQVWRLKLVLKGAEALGVYFEDFWLPPGGKLFLYDAAGAYVLGAFTERNNQENRLFATDLVPGDEAILEYYQPSAESEKPSLLVSEVSYTYRNSGFSESRSQLLDECYVDVNCSPEGNQWQKQKRSVVRINLKTPSGTYYCTGALVNNTRDDFKPYLLTAGHCGADATPASDAGFGGIPRQGRPRRGNLDRGFVGARHRTWIGTRRDPRSLCQRRARNL